MHFVLEKSRLVGRKERGRGVAAGAGSEGVAAAPKETQEWGWAPDVGPPSLAG